MAEINPALPLLFMFLTTPALLHGLGWYGLVRLRRASWRKSELLRWINAGDVKKMPLEMQESVAIA